MLKKIIGHYKDDPEGYWFKRKIYGWGWVPVTWQGWIVTLLAVAFIAGGVYVGETDDAPGAAVLGMLFAAALLFGFGYLKGEKASWQWGLPEDESKNDSENSPPYNSGSMH